MAGLPEFETVWNLVDDRERSPNERPRLGGASALVAAVALILSPSANAAVAALGAFLLLAAWYLFSPAYAFALGHVALGAVLPARTFLEGVDIAWLVVVEIGLLGILLASVTHRSATRVASPDETDWFTDTSSVVVGAGFVLGWAVIGGTLAWASARSSLGLPSAGGLLVVLFALVGYGLHRYQLVSLGLVGDGDE